MCVTGIAALSTAPIALAVAPNSFETTSIHLAQDVDTQSPPPSAHTQHVIDHSGVLSDSDIAELEDMIAKVRQQEQRDMYVVYQPTFGTLDPNKFAEDTFKLNAADNVLVFAVATETRKYAVAHRTENSAWSQREITNVKDAAHTKLVELDFRGAAFAAVKAGGGKALRTPEEEAAATRSTYTFLGTGAASVVAAGGGVWYLNRRRKAKNIASAREIEPGNVHELSNQPIEVLEELAKEELVSTDESIRRARDELDLAMSEFGAERVRPFTSAMNSSTSTLQRAFQLQQKINSGQAGSPAQRKAMLVDIVSSCGLADDALDKVAAEFAELRNLLVNAPSKIEQLTQQTIDLRSRIPHAGETLQQLQQTYAPSIIDSIDENVDLASELTTQAESNIDSAREQLSLPPGSQGGVIDAIRNAENAVSHADKALSSVENAATDIAAAQAGIGLVITEIEQEVEEAKQLKAVGKAQGSHANWDKVAETLNRAPDVLSQARENADADPLTTYSTLVEYDAELDLLLDTVRESNAQQARALQILDNTLQSAEAALRSADDFIGTRGKIVGSSARAQLAEGHRQHALALQNRTTDTRAAIVAAQEAQAIAKRALKGARSDVNAHYARQSSANSSFTTGMIAGHIMSSGGGGFSSGFSGFSGGGGGGVSSSSGSF